MNKFLYQIENSMSGRRVIYQGFDKIEWSPGDGEDGTFFTEDQMEFIIKIIGGLNCGISIVRYQLERFNEWPIGTKEANETKSTLDEDDCSF